MSRKRKAIELEGPETRTPRTPTPTPYAYNSLRSGCIRVLVLYPGQYDDPLRATMRAVRLRYKPPYKVI